MTDELRLILLFAGVLIIGYIAWDASRRKKQTELQPPSNDSVTSSLSTSNAKDEHANLDDDRYDDLGLTQARIAGGPSRNSSNLEDEKMKNIRAQEVELEATPEIIQDDLPERLEPSFEDEDETLECAPQESILTQSESESESEPQLNEVDNIETSENISTNELQDSSNLETIQKPETVITINLMSEPDNEFKGTELLQELLTLGFKFGEMGVFHRYQNANGQGERWFCLANAINPGVFDLDKMEQFSTPGLTLFMLLPGPQQPADAFENMLNAANKLKSALGGKLEDGSHSVLTQQRIQLYREEILNFQRVYLAKMNHSDEIN